MPSIADTYITMLPETSKIADGLRRAFREVDPSVREAGKRWGREIEQSIGKPKVELQADTAKAEAQIDAAARDRKATVEVDADTMGGSVERAITQGGMSGISALQPALLGVGVTMLAGIGSALSGLTALIPAGLLGAGGVVGTLVTGLSGVKDAWDAAGKAADASGTDQAAKAKEVSSAQRGLTDANVSLSDAQKDLSNAWKDARQQLDDLNLSLQGGKISEAQAYNDVLKARQDLAKGGFKDQLELNDAQLRVAAAEQRWKESKQRNIELQDKANDANAKGVAGSDLVTQAQERVRRANEQVTVAQQNLNDATNKTSTTAQNAADAMAKLSPNAQAFLNTLMAMKPQFEAFKNSIQDALFANLGPQFQQLATTYMPLLQNFMGGMAQTMNQAFGQLATFLQNPQTMQAMQQVFANIGSSFQVWAQALQPFSEAFLKVTQVGSGFLPQLAQMVVQVADAFNQWAQSGQLGEWIQTGMTALQQLGGLVQQLLPMFAQLAPIGIATMSALQTVFAALQPSIAPLSQAFSSLIVALTPALGMIGQLVSTVITAVAPALTTWFNALGPVIQQLAGVLQPVMQQLQPVIAQLANVLAGVMVEGIKTILPVLGPFVSAFGQLVVAVAPLLPNMVQLATSALPLMQQAIATMLPVATDFITKLTDLANLVIPPLTGVLSGLSGTFSDAFTHMQSVIETVWPVIKPVLETMKTLVEAIAGPLVKIGLIADDWSVGNTQGGQFLPKPGQTVPGSTPTSPLVPGRTGLMPGQTWTPGPGQQPMQWVNGKGWVPVAAPAAATPSIPAPATVTPSSYAPTGGYPGDAALLANVPAGRYEQTQAADLTKGIADCSSAVEDLVNILQGRPTTGRSMATGNEAQWLTAHGFVQGMGGPGDFRVGFNSGHTQATLPGGTPFNWGSDAAAARRGIGGTGADDPAFTSHYYLPITKMPGSAAPSIPNLTGNPGTPGPLGTQEDPMYVSLPDSVMKQQQSGGPGEQLGQDLLSGIGQIFGFDGSVFKDPTSFGLFKIFKGLMGLKVKDGAPSGSDGSLSGGGGGDLFSSLLSFIPKPFDALKSGSPGQAPGEFMPLMPGSGGGDIAQGLPDLAKGISAGAQQLQHNDNRIVFNGPVGQPQTAFDAATGWNVPRARQGVRALPK